MQFLKVFFESPQNRKMSWAIFALFTVYFLIRFSYFTIDVFNYDEHCHSGRMDSSLLKQTKLYQAFSPLYWILGHLVLRIIGNSDITFGKMVLRLTFISFQFLALLTFYRTAERQNYQSQKGIFLIMLLILFAPISFFGGKAITPEYLQLLLFSICLYHLSQSQNDEKKLVWFVAGISAGLKMHSLAVLPFLFLFRIIVLSNNFSWKSFFNKGCEVSKIAIPFAIYGLALANFSFIFYFNESLKSLQTVSSGDHDILSRLGVLFKGSQDPECWESICPYYVKDSYSQLLYNLISPWSLVFFVAAFVIAANKAKNIAILVLLIVCFFTVQAFLATGYTNYPWYHLTYFPLFLSMLLHLEIADFSKLRKSAFYGAIIAAIIGNLSTTIYMIRTDYSFRENASELIDNSARNTACIDQIISDEKPDAYIFAVISLFNGHESSFVDIDFLRQTHFSSTPKMFNYDGKLFPESMQELAKKKNIKLIFSIDEVSAKYNKAGYDYQKRINLVKSGFEKHWQQNFPQGKVVSEIEELKPCYGISNYAVKVNIH